MNGAGGGVKAYRTTPEEPFSLETVVVALKIQILCSDSAEEKVFGQGRPVVGTVVLIANDEQLAVEALSAGCPGSRQARQGSSHDRKRLHVSSTPS
jgi:hypothetical protein